MKPLMIAAAAATLAGPAAAQAMQGAQGQPMGAMDHSRMNHGAMANTAANPFGQAEMAMHEAMMKAQGADASETFVRKMIEHHRGAVAMGRIALRDARDREARAVAQKTVDTQTREIAQLQGWLKRHGKAAQ